MIDRLLDTVVTRMRNAEKTAWKRIDQNEGEAMGTKDREKDRERMMLETRESRLLLWDLLRLRYPRWKLAERLIPVDEILPELTQALNGHPKSRKYAFKKWQRMRLWPPPEILHSCEEQVWECQND